MIKYISLFFIMIVFVLGQSTPSLNSINYTSGNNSFSLSWSHNTAISGSYYFQNYEIYYTNNGQIYTAWSKSKTFSNMATGTHTYKVRAVYSQDDIGPIPFASKTDISAPLVSAMALPKKMYSSWSSTKAVTVTESTPVPPTPSLYSATANSVSSITLSWQNVSNESGYYIYRSTSSGSGYSNIATLGANSTSFTNSGLASSTTYYYKVRSYNGSGASGYSSYKSAKTLTPTIVTKEVVWAHGKGKDEEFFEDFATSFQNERHMISDRASYNTAGGFVASANQLRYQHGLYANNPSDDRIIVGHSYGGVLARKIEQMSPDTYFGGIVSIGSPHQGAEIARSSRNGDMGWYTFATLANLAAGPVASAFNDPSQLYGALPLVYSTTISAIIGAVTDKVAFDDTDAARDLEPNSAAINDLNNSTLNVPKIGIYGVEDHNNQFRLAASAGGLNEQSVMSIINDLADGYESVSDAYSWYAGIAWGAYIWTGNDTYLAYAFYYSSYAYAWYIGERTLEDWAQDSWNDEIIGNSENLESDGFISKASQLMPDAFRNYEAKGANHAEQNTHSAVRSRLNEIFELNNAFKIETR